MLEEHLNLRLDKDRAVFAPVQRRVLDSLADEARHGDRFPQGFEPALNHVLDAGR